MVSGWLHVLFMLNFELVYLKIFLVKNASSESLEMYSLIQYSTMDLSRKSAKFYLQLHSGNLWAEECDDTLQIKILTTIVQVQDPSLKMSGELVTNKL